jgi:hypothetical protein
MIGKTWQQLQEGNMKTPEDEAFEDIERRQGGGFPAKRQMAMHKTQDQNICRHYKQWQHCHICDLESQVAELASIKAILDEYGLQAIDFVVDFKAALAQPAQEPVAWVGLTDEEIGAAYVIWDATDGASFADFARAIEQMLKEKNG